MLSFLIIAVLIVFIVYKLDLSLDLSKDDLFQESYFVILWYTKFWTSDKRRNFIVIF